MNRARVVIGAAVIAAVCTFGAQTAQAAPKHHAPVVVAHAASTKSELKSIIEHCVGFGLSGAGLAKLVSSPKVAFKFIIRRIGFAAALSCAGGVVWKYV